MPDAEWLRWQPHLEPVELRLGNVIYESKGSLSHVYFPTTAIVSLLYATLFCADRRLKMRTSTNPAQLDRMFFALADVNRRGMLDRLSRGPASVSELAEPLSIALPSAVKHLAVLEHGGFVASQKSGRVRTYTLQPRALDAMDAWVGKHKAQLNAQFDRLEGYLAARRGATR